MKIHDTASGVAYLNKFIAYNPKPYAYKIGRGEFSRQNSKL